MKYEGKYLRNCQECGKIFKAKYRNGNFCSKKCYQKNWRKNHKGYVQKTRKNYRKENPVYYKNYQKRIQLAFSSWKESFGCQICRYSLFGYNLVLHHFFNKKFVISSNQFCSLKSKDLKLRRRTRREIKKCILVCKLCHGDIHHGRFSQKFIFKKFIEFQKRVKL